MWALEAEVTAEAAAAAAAAVAVVVGKREWGTGGIIYLD